MTATNVLVSDSGNAAYDGNMSTANAWYQVEAYNWGAQCSTTSVALTTSYQYINVTFSNAATLKGIGLNLLASTSCDRGVQVNIEKNTGSWVEQENVTLTFAQITDSATHGTGSYLIPFPFSTASITTDASTWRIGIRTSGGSAGVWSFKTSNGTLATAHYMAWGNNQVSFASNTQSLFIYSPIKIDATATIKGMALPTGSTDYSTAITVFKSTPGTPNLTWTTSASITLTCAGSIMLSKHSQIKFGTSKTVPITTANQGTIIFTTPTYGTNAGFACDWPSSGGYYHGSGSSIEIYGQIPSPAVAVLASDANTGQKVVVTTTSTGWAKDDTVFIGKQNTQGAGATTVHTIDSVVGDTITLTTNLATANRIAGGHIFKTNGYGFQIKWGTSSFYSAWLIHDPSVFKFSGVYFQDNYLNVNYGNTNAAYYDDASNRSQWEIVDCCVVNVTSSSIRRFFGNVGIPPKGFLVQRVYTAAVSFVYQELYYRISGYTSGTFTVKDSVFCSSPSYPHFIPTDGYLNLTCDFQDNYFYNSGGTGVTYFMGLKSTYKNNYIWGGGTNGCMIHQLISPVEISGNSYINNAVGQLFDARLTLGCIDEDAVFSSNTADISFTATAYIDYEHKSPTGNLTVTTTDLANTTEGSRWRISDWNDTINDDRNYLTYGYINRTGYGLSDTTVYDSTTGAWGEATSGKFGMRLESTDGENTLTWTQTIPTGNILGSTMMIIAHCKINSANYYGGTNYQLPRLTATFDNGASTAYFQAEAKTDGQVMFVPITPKTSAGDLTFTISAQTDATGSDAYVYFDYFEIQYPSGVSPNFSLLNLWTHADPVTPTVSIINVDGGSTWDALMANHTITGTFGKDQADKNIRIDDNSVLNLL